MRKRTAVRTAIEQPVDKSIRYIPLTLGKYAIVDADCYENLKDFAWYAFQRKGTTYYARYDKRVGGRNGRLVRIYMHHLVLNPDGNQVDHRDGNGLNNTRSNLRHATVSQNCQNRPIRSDNTSGFKGVVQRPNGTFEAKVSINKKQVHLGTFATAELASQAYVHAAQREYGEFFRKF